jgi:hypothetical protein
MTITLQGVLTLLSALEADYTSFEAGQPVHVQEVDATLGTTKIALDLTVTKRATEGANPFAGLNIGEALGLFTDYEEFMAGSTISLPELDFALGKTVVGLALALHKK